VKAPGRQTSVLLHSRAFYPQIGGLERVSEILAGQLTAEGLRITVLTDTPLGSAEEAGPYKVLRRPHPGQVKALVDEADVVHVNGFSVQLVRHCRRAGKPLIWTHAGFQAVCTEGNLLHGSSRCEGRLGRCAVLSARARGARWAARHVAEVIVRRALLRTAAANVCVTHSVASRIRAPRSRVISNPIDVSALAPGDKAPARGCFSFFGRLVTEKGAHVLLEALRLCREAGHRFTVRLVGDGPEREPLQAQARRLGIADAVCFTGALVAQPLRRAQAEAWVVVVPSVCEEAMGLVAVEAMATGAPLIVSRRGGLLEVAEGCAIGFENAASRELASAMIRISGDEPLWRKLASAGPERARRFDSRTIARQYVQLYDEVLV
jgi:glycogen(starch) synthase